MKNNSLVSVIVPTKNSENTIGLCIKSIKNQSYKNLEIIVIDNNSTDKTKEISKKYTKLIFNKEPERSAQRNYGAIKSKGKFLLFIDSDMELTKNVVKDCVEKISLDRFKALVVPEKSFGVGFWAQCKALERSFYVGVDWIEAARFFDEKTFREFKGYDEKQTGTEDFDLPQRVKSKYGIKSIGRINSFINHNDRKLSLAYTLKKKYYYAKTVKRYSSNKVDSVYFKLQANPLNRYILFFKKPNVLFKNPVVGIGMLFMKTTEFCSGALGYLSK